MIILGIILWLSFIPFEVFRNYRWIEIKKKRPAYFNFAVVRITAGLACLVIMYPHFDPLGNWWSVLGAVPYVIFEISSFYLVFDSWLNIKRGKKWFYKGEDSGILDDMPYWAYYIMKILCLIALPWSLIVILK